MPELYLKGVVFPETVVGSTEITETRNKGSIANSANTPAKPSYEGFNSELSTRQSI
jgi:hypothetical protein